MCTSEHSSAGMLTSSSAAAIAAASSSNGVPACGLRVPSVTGNDRTEGPGRSQSRGPVAPALADCSMARRTLTLRERRALRQAVNDEAGRLDDQIVALTSRFDDIVEAAALTNTDDEHDPEGATIAFERAQVTSLLRQTTADRTALRDTLERLEEPAYGTCEVCADFIGVERLMALPSTRRCIRCAS